MGEFFGTDGIRGIANRYPLDGETVVQIGRAIADYFSMHRPEGSRRFVIGQDPRISGNMLVHAIAAGICSMGIDVHLAGIVPTPAVAYLAQTLGYDAGIVISASHNPFADNGIKLFGGDGYKLSDDAEAAIEKRLANAASLSDKSSLIQNVGKIQTLDHPSGPYGRFLSGCLDSRISLAGMKVVVDGSNGAASELAPRLFAALGAKVHAIFCSPDGTNINAACGSQYPQALAKQVVAQKADLGLAFDGDADRLIAVDEKGHILTGDQVMAILAESMQAHGELPLPVVVTTVMSNLGFGQALKGMNIEHIKAGVGDRYVMQEMVNVGAVFGGEDSGHMIFLNHHTTGDGLLAAIKLMEAMRRSRKPLSALAKVMTVFPQCLINVDVTAKPPIESIEAIRQEIEQVEKELGDTGRVLVRYSGTQPQCRVMVEGPTEAETNTLCRRIASVVERVLG